MRMSGETLREKKRKPANIEYWDGHTADRIVASLAQLNFSNTNTK
jgi:hypothetical protein